MNKIILAKLLDSLQVIKIVRFISNKIYSKNHIRVVNYHCTPKKEASNFEKHLRYYKKNYSSVNLEDLDRFFSTKRWHKDKPGLIISFDDGLRSNYDFALPLLKKYHFNGWFLIPYNFIESPVDEQISYVKKANINTRQKRNDLRLAMTWDEILNLSIDHIVCSHTMSHHLISKSDDAKKLQYEIGESKKKLEEKTQKTISVFGWVGGGTFFTKEGMNIVKEHGYNYSFKTSSYPILKKTNPLQIHRTNIESYFPLSQVKMALSGIMDVYYKNERKINDDETSLS